MQLDEDDLYDYDQDSFDEDAVITDVIKALKPLRISEHDAEVALEKVDWDVPAAIASLKKQHQPKKAPQKPAPKPTPAVKPDGKLSALQRLAQQRTQQNSPQNSQQPPSTEVPTQAPSLAQIAARRRAQSEESSTTGSSALERLMQRKKSSTPRESLAALKAKSSKQSKSTVPATQATPETQPPAAKPWTPPISYERPSFAGLKPPSEFGALIGTSGTSFFRNAETNTFVAQDAKKAFSGPSPDEVVLTAQSQGFGAKAGTKAGSPAPKSVAKAPTPKQKAAQPKSEAQKSELVAKLANLKMKPSCSFVVIGHVDAGKSTLMGRLLLDTGALSQKVVSKFEHESSKVGKSSFWLAWALDATKEERERGVTVDVGEASFETKSTRFTVLDAPGHRDYVPNMIAGVAQADVAVLVVDSDTNAFESGFSLDGQTKEHAILARSLGVDRVVVAVNKMDTQDWSEDRFEDISVQLTEFLGKKVGFDTTKVVYVPTSGITGVNVVSGGGPSWYKGPTLVVALEQFAVMNPQNTNPVSDPVRFLVSNAYVEPFQSTITTSGRVLSGVIEKGDVLDLVGLGRQATIKSIAGDAEFLGSREVGEIKLQLDSSGTSEEDSVAVRPGDVIASPNAGLVATKQFVAKIQVFDIPRPILPGTKLAFHMGRVDDTVKVTKIIESLSKTAAKKIRHLGRGAAARVELELGNPAVLTPPTVCKDLGRFVLRLNGATIGGGVVDTLLE